MSPRVLDRLGAEPRVAVHRARIALGIMGGALAHRVSSSRVGRRRLAGRGTIPREVAVRTGRMGMRALFEVYGRRILVVRSGGRWTVYYAGEDGKRRRANDLVVPAGVAERDVERYLADVCHEWASETYPDVRRLR